VSKHDIWEIEISHDGLNKYRHIRGRDRYVVEQKAQAQKLLWEEMWQKKLAADKRTQNKERAIRDKEGKKELAQIRTAEAQSQLDELENILRHTLSVDDVIDWSSLEDKRRFSTPRPLKARAMPAPDEPKASNERYQVELGLFDKLFKSRGQKKLNDAKKRFQADHADWVIKKKNYEDTNKRLDEQLQLDIRDWEIAKADYEAKQTETNQKIQESRENYLKLVDSAVIDYCEMVLSNSEYPECFPQDWDIDYSSENKILVVDYSLPDISALPTLKSVKYVASTDDFTESSISEAALNKLYDSVIYQVALRTLHELFEADAANALASVVFNGWVESTNRATGQKNNACIISVQAGKDEFLAINLAHVDPKACFKELKGVGSSKLHGLSPVAPIMNINKEDRRFVSPYDVVNNLDEGDNLAAMDWQDFENLIREIFHKEFLSSGGEVKITQASRDGGVDAVAFDPDPIRGGKIVIQAKRYTNVVGVSAVRDLYGTTMNEGATKGILVTTAQFGPDAYEFAKGKPLTLLNGSNLLHLLEKHGHKARIDLREAKNILNERV